MILMNSNCLFVDSLILFVPLVILCLSVSEQNIPLTLLLGSSCSLYVPKQVEQIISKTGQEKMYLIDKRLIYLTFFCGRWSEKNIPNTLFTLDLIRKKILFLILCFRLKKGFFGLGQYPVNQFFFSRHYF